MSRTQLRLTDIYSLTEINFGEALMEAERLDAHLESTGQTVGPLHGVPISFKVGTMARLY
jgi:Asp-tRNA(Asn)/Glu-tRNA(Gln) amidotransferase A subunit family amidase